MGMDISNARDAYSNAKTAFKRAKVKKVVQWINH